MKMEEYIESELSGIFKEKTGRQKFNNWYPRGPNADLSRQCDVSF